MELLELNKENFDKVISENKNIIVDVYTAGCGPCKNLEKELKILMETQNLNLLICKLDVMNIGKSHWIGYYLSTRFIVFIKRKIYS